MALVHNREAHRVGQWGARNQAGGTGRGGTVRGGTGRGGTGRGGTRRAEPRGTKASRGLARRRFA
ncbi:hypothetical protein FVP60_01155 [Microbacterium mitrae]|uniref:Uncharacterized protein n=1 Tax=Microbacterium mitrae TaxID=664640 RepID=A0A5C8HQT4_9MICO|nr:hypothetical protein FVP60_01155 [Microbacterium mitrae]